MENINKDNKGIFSVDAETDGLWGNVFAIAAIVYDKDGKEIDKICLRLPNEVVTNEWVKENVLPTLDFPITHDINKMMVLALPQLQEKRIEKAYKCMLYDFSKFYMKYKDTTNVLYHMGHIVEAHLFREMHRLGYVGDWDAPYTPIEVADHLRIANEPCDSVDSYVKKYNLKINDYGSTHNPLYDCEVAFKVYHHLVNEIRKHLYK